MYNKQVLAQLPVYPSAHGWDFRWRHFWGVRGAVIIHQVVLSCVVWCLCCAGKPVSLEPATNNNTPDPGDAAPCDWDGMPIRSILTSRRVISGWAWEREPGLQGSGVVCAVAVQCASSHGGQTGGRRSRSLESMHRRAARECHVGGHGQLMH